MAALCIKPMTKDTELLTVQEHFEISSRGLVLSPDFDVPRGWRNHSESVVVVTPGGEAREFVANLELIHFNIRDPNVDVNRRWRVSVSLPSANKLTVPVGSKVLCESELRSAVSGRGNA